MRDPFLGMVLLLAFSLRIYGLDHGLPFVYNPDEANIMARALSVAKGIDPGYYLYPSFFFYFLFVAMGGLFVFGLLLGRYENLTDFQVQFFSNPTDFYILGRFVSVAAALITIVVTYRLAAKHFGQTAARAASLFTAVAYFNVRDAHYLKHDVVSGLLFVLSLWAIDRAIERKRTQDYISTGIVFGIAFATHYYMIFLAPALVACHWTARRFEKISQVFYCGAASVITFCLLSPFVVLRLSTAISHMQSNREVVVDRSLAEGVTFFPSLGLYVEFLVTQGLGFILFTLVLIGVVLMAYKSRFELILWGVFPLSFFLFLTYTFFAGRYLNPILPSLSVFAGLTISIISARFGKKIAFTVMSLACLQPLYHSVQIDRLFASNDTRTIAREWILRNVSSDATIVLQSYSVPLPQSRPSFFESMKANTALSELERNGKYASLLDVAEKEKQSYWLYFLGQGEELNRVYDSGLLRKRA